MALWGVTGLVWGLFAPDGYDGARAAEHDGFGGFLSTREVGAERWLATRKNADGRGVVIAVLDTGVDPSRPGLDKLPDGRVKLIEARDFTGQGDVALVKATLIDGVLRADGVELRGAATLEKPLGRTGHWVGVFSEASLRQSSVEDIDGDGRTDTRFAMVVYQRADGEAVVVVDSDGDGDLSGEVVRRSYADEPRPMFFGRAPKRRIAVLPTVLLHERKVSLHFDDGAHGTHCAGIAAGFGIEGRAGFNGVAPGAELMSLKIGHGALTGGATVAGSMVEAIRFVSAWARERARPVVISMSYGVGSETEGRSRIDEILDEELAANPWLVASVSAGNEGPGFSSVGTPAAATLAVAVAAMVTPAMAETLLGARALKVPRVFGFSSRGGELDKPDVLAPGIAWSTVPAFHEGAVMNGTSMAAPQVSGVLALVWSAALEDKLAVTGGLLRRALRQGAKPIAGYTTLDQGAGLVDVGATYEALRRGTALSASAALAGFRVETAVPAEAGAVASASFWRVGANVAGLGVAVGRENSARVPITFEVKPVIYGTVPDEQIPGLFQRVELKSDVAWLEVDRRELGLKGDTASEVVVRADFARLAGSPGVHLGRVRASQGGLWAFDLPVVVVVPHTFRDTWAKTFEGKLMPGEVARVLVEVPPGASAMNTTLTATGEGAVWLVPFDPAGRHVEAYEHRASEPEQAVARFGRARPELTPGTWELTVMAPLKNAGGVGFALEVVFTAIEGPAVLPVEVGSAGIATGELTLVNRMDQPFLGSLEARVIGQGRVRQVEMEGVRQSVGFEVGPGIATLELEVELDKATWARMTDFAFQVTSGGAVVEQGALGQRVARVSVPVSAGQKLELELVAGLAEIPAETGEPMRLVVRELHRYASPAVWAVGLPGAMSRPTLHSGVPTAFSLSSPGLPALGGGFSHLTELALTSRDGALWQRWRLPHSR